MIMSWFKSMYQQRSDFPDLVRSKRFVGGLAIGLTLGLGSLFYLRRQIQGYWRDNYAVVSLQDLTGRTAIITGGNSGIGLGTAIHLAKRNANVIIACRNQNKADVALKYIKRESKNDNVYVMSLDLSDLRSVEKFAADVNASQSIDVDYLILNAGIGTTPGKKPISCDGLNTLFQANYFSHWYLTNLLFNRIKATADKRWAANANKYGPPVRIVSVSSGLHSAAELPLDDDKEWDAMVKDNCSYAQSKLLQIIHMRKLQRVLHEYDQMIQCLSVSPGFARTSIMSNVNPVLKWVVNLTIYPVYWFLSRDIMTGSQVVLHAVCNDSLTNGAYLSNCREKRTKGKTSTNDESVWDKAWDRSHAVLVDVNKARS